MRILPFLLLLVFINAVVGFSVTINNVRDASRLKMKESNEAEDVNRRRQILGQLLAVGVVGTCADRSYAVERAVGGAEIACREQGNCLEKGEWDGAVGWNWGATDRCDPSDPRCGTNGVLMDAPPSGEPVPVLNSDIKVTHEVTLALTVGRGESGTLRLGLFGEATPKSVQQLVEFLSPAGFSTSSRLLFEDGYGLVSAPLSMAKGYGLLTTIVPSQSLSFGIPSQAAAYAKSKGKAKAGNDFTPQPRPREKLKDEATTRGHDAAGLVSIPGSGLGYANNGPEDEAFADGE